MNHLILDCFCFLFLGHRQDQRGRNFNSSARRFEISANNCRVYRDLAHSRPFIGWNDVDVFWVGLLNGVASVVPVLSALAILQRKTADDNESEDNE